MRHKFSIVVAALFVLIVILRFAIAPPLVRNKINHDINSRPGMSGSIQNVRFQLFRGRTLIHGINVQIKEGNVTTKISAANATARIKLGSLFHGNIIADLTLIRPKLDYIVSGPPPKKAPEKTQGKVAQVLKKEPRFRIDSLTIRDGSVHYVDKSKSPHYELTADRVNGRIFNISNSRKLNETLFATMDFKGRAQDSGEFHLTGKFNPIRQPVEFKINLALRGLALEKLNPALLATKDLRIQHGILSLASEVAAKNGKVDGYVKPVIHQLQVSNFKKDIKKGLGHALKEQAVNLGAQIAKNPSHDTQATRIPFHGKLDDPKMSIGAALQATLQNMFAQAIAPNIEHSVSLAKAG